MHIKTLNKALLLLFFLITESSIYGQCFVNATANNYEIFCGEEIILNAQGNTENIFEIDFNDKTLGTGLETVTKHVFTNPCEDTPDNSTYLWFTEVGNGGPRGATTVSLDLSNGGFISFDMRFSAQGTAGICEGPDLVNEGIYLEYSTDNGANWTTLEYYTTLGGVDPVRTSWTRYNVAIPPDAQTPNTKIRWNQREVSFQFGAAFDHWGLDNIKIDINPNDIVYTWEHTGIPKKNGITPNVQPFETTKYVVKFELDGCVLYDTVTIVVNELFIDALADPSINICPNTPVQLSVLSNIESTLPKNCGPTNKTECDPIFDESSQLFMGFGTITLRSQTSTRPLFIANTFDDQSQRQFLFRASELKALGFEGGLITRMQLETFLVFSSSEPIPYIVIKAKCTDKDELTEWVDGAEELGAYNNYDFALGYNAFDFDKGFNWDGESNIVFEFCFFQDAGKTWIDWSPDAYFVANDPGYIALNTRTTSANSSSGSCEIPENNIVEDGAYFLRPNVIFDVCKPRSSKMTFEWSSNNGTIDDIFNDSPIGLTDTTTTYYVTSSFTGAPESCAKTDSVVVTVEKNIPTPEPYYNAGVCQKDTLKLFLGEDFLLPNTNVLWKGPSNFTSVDINPIILNSAPSNNGYYTVSVFSESGCLQFQDSIDVIISASKNPGLDTVITICESDSTLNLFDLLNGNPEVGGTWTETIFGETVNDNTFNINNKSDSTIEPYRFLYSHPAVGFCTDTVAELVLNIINAPNIELVPDFAIQCKDSTVNISMLINGASDDAGYTVLVSDGFNNYPNPNTNIKSGDSFAVSIDKETKYSVIELIDNTPLQCPTQDTVELILNVYEQLIVGLVEERCHSDLSFFVPVLEITGGDSTSYIYDLFVDGILQKKDAEVLTLPMAQDTIVNGSTYSYVFRDLSNCEDSQTSISREPEKHCECVSYAGTMNTELLDLCEDERAITDETKNAFLETVAGSEDTLLYILHNTNGITEGIVYDTNFIPEFDFIPGVLQYNVKYYISAVVGTKLIGSGYIDPEDTCKAINRGTPVVWRQKPIIKNLEAFKEVCFGETARIEYSIEGNPPFLATAQYQNSTGILVDTTLIFERNIGALSLLLPESRTFFISEIQILDNQFSNQSNSCANIINESFSIKVNPLPTARFNSTGNSLVGCEGEVLSAGITLTGQAPFFLKYNIFGTIVEENNLPNAQYSFNVNQTGLVELISVSDASGCIGIIEGGNIVDVEFKKRPKASITKDPSAVCGNQIPLAATPSFGTGQWFSELGGTVGSDFEPRTTGIANFADTTLTFYWTESNAPCPVSTDSVEVFFRKDPLPVAGKNDTICGLTYTFKAQSSISASEGLRVWSQVDGDVAVFNNVNLPEATVSVPNSGRYSFAYIESVDGVCVNSDTVDILFIDTPTIVVLDTICDLVSENYTVYYRVFSKLGKNIVTNGTPVGIGYELSAKTGTTLTIEASLNLGCAPKTSLSINYQCPCISDIDIIRSDTIKVCKNDVFSFTDVPNYTLDPNDTLLYVLKESADINNLNDIVYTSKTNKYVFTQSSIKPNTLYYAMVLVGNASTKNTVGIDFTDRCLARTPPVPVLVQANYNLLFPNKINFCENEIQNIDVLNIPSNTELTVVTALNGTLKNYTLNKSNNSILLNLPVGQHFLEIGTIKSNDGFDCASKNIDLIEVNIYAKPTVNFDFDAALCVGEETVISILNGQFKNSEIVLVGLDTLKNKNNFYTFNQAGDYRVKVTLENYFNCKSTEFYNINVQDIPKPEIEVNDFVCYPDDINGRLLSPNPDVVTRKWRVNGFEKPGFLQLNYSPISKGIYNITLEEISSNGCFGKSTKTVNVTQPTADFSIVPDSICSSSNLLLSFTNAQDYSSYRWEYSGYKNGNSSAINLNLNLDSNTFSTNRLITKLILEDSLGCINTITDSIGVQFVYADFNYIDNNYCEGDTFSTINNSVNANSFNWMVGKDFIPQLPILDNYKFTEADSTRIVLIATNTLNACIDSAISYINVYAKPLLKTHIDTICPGVPTEISVSGAEIYNWVPETFLSNPFIPNPIITTFTDQVYFVQGNSSEGCISDTTFIVPYYDIDSPDDLSVTDTYFIGDSVRITIKPQNNFSYEWYNDNGDLICVNCLDSLFNILQNTNFTIISKDEKGCYAQENYLSFTVEEKYTLDFPDAFTPNNDGINDVIRPDGLGIEEYILVEIYNRTGSLLFKGKGNKIAWDGYYKGELQPAEVYTFKVIARFYDSLNLEVIRGDFNLLR